MKKGKSMTLYPKLLGPEWNRLPDTLKRGYGGEGKRYGKGRFIFRRGESITSKFIGWIESLPQDAGGIDSEVLVIPNEEGETWNRKFGSHIFVTEQREKDGFLTERFGILEFYFKLKVEDGALVFVPEKVVWEPLFFSLDLPGWLAPKIMARTWEDNKNGKTYLGIRIEVSSPLTGLIWSHEGLLDID
jgi:hypothetical protein